MNNATEMRKQSDSLEIEISNLLREFVKDNGNCDIDLSCQLTYETTHLGHKKDLVSAVAKVNVTI